MTACPASCSAWRTRAATTSCTRRCRSCWRARRRRSKGIACGASTTWYSSARGARSSRSAGPPSTPSPRRAPSTARLLPPWWPRRRRSWSRSWATTRTSRRPSTRAIATSRATWRGGRASWTSSSGSRAACGASITPASTTSTRSRRPGPNRGATSAVVRMPSMARPGETVVLVMLLVLPARAGGDLPVRRALQAASVVVESTGCAGAVAENRQTIVTAKHCVKGQTLRVRLSTGSERTAWVVAVNDASDQAVLFLEEPADVEPLAIVRRRQIPGTVLYFEGNPERTRFQSARLDRVGRCPSLPDLPNALLTGIDGRPGASGPPLVNGAAEIVGLEHGRVGCQTETPADPLAPLVDHVLGRGVVETTRAAPARAKVA